MYKLLLCWRYLCTRYIALASIVSVTLGVATLIVVNSVMQGFTGEMQNRIRGVVSDLLFSSRAASTGMSDFDWHADKDSRNRRRSDRGHFANGRRARDAQLSDTATLGSPSQVDLVGIDEENAARASVSDFGDISPTSGKNRREL